jgi:LmbE family N-acetylglucosaminyl deacetylase
MKKMNILAIGAHPDDIEFGCGGTLIKYAQTGHNVFLLVMTHGDQGGISEIRSKEQKVSQKIIGAKEVYWGGYKDTHLIVDKELITKIEKIIYENNPDLIFCHYSRDTHQDHRHLTQAVMSAARNLKNVMFYEGPTTQNFSAGVFVDITGTIENKMDSLMAHESQITKTNIEDLSIVEIARSLANFRGIQGRVKYAEAFQPLRLFINI